MTMTQHHIFEVALQTLSTLFSTLRTEVGRLEARAASLRTEVDQREALRAEQAELRTQIAKMRGELTRERARLQPEIEREQQRLDAIRGEIDKVLRAVRPYRNSRRSRWAPARPMR